MVQTRPDSTAHLNANGSSVMVLADSLVKFEGPAVEIEHGAVRVSTAQGMATRAGEVTIKPAGSSWTEFQVTDVDGQVQIMATKGDLTVQDQQGTTTVQQGQQTTRDDSSNPEKKKKKKRRGAGAATAAGGGIMSSTPAILTGIGVVGGVTAWVLLQGDEPLSPACPTPTCQ
jgi:ferric-dicitrate binding protein FerR (iron transport regulator)